MRNYQTKQNVGGVPDSISDTKYGAGEFNSLAQENENAVIRSGQTPANASGTSEIFDQLAKAMFINGTGAGAMVDNGSANTYELTPVTGAAGLVVPDDYDHMDGAVIMFRPDNAPTGASTVKIGQDTGSYLAAKALLTAEGADMQENTFDAGALVVVQYDSTADGGSGAFIILPIVNDNTVNILTGGSVPAIPGRVNEVQDSNTYSIPAADSVAAGEWVVIEKPDKYSDQSPTFEVAAGDTITDIDGADPDGEILLDAGYSEWIRLTSDGVSDWRL